MLDLMLMFYNGEHETQPATLVDHLTQVFNILHFWKAHNSIDSYD